VRTNENSSDRKKIAKKATVNDSPLVHKSRTSVPNPDLTAKYCSNTMPAGSELAGSV
jgi:hypothetical protein